MERYEVLGVIAVIDFVYWLAANTPFWAFWIWALLGVAVIIDWMNGGITD